MQMLRDDSPLHYCRVCGLWFEDPPWGEDGHSPDFTFCACCGVEFGYQDCKPEGARLFRKAWIEKGANWDEPKMRPANWRLEAQLEQVPAEFR